MNPERHPLKTGGCQCGQVRYAIYGEHRNPHICHCRMCQKAFGSFFAPLVGIRLEDFAWTRGEPAVFRSSDIAERGFCRDCGTPLFYRYPDAGHLSLSIGSLDEPATVQPQKQFGIEARMPWFAELPSLPGTTTEEEDPADLLARLNSHQHPDHDTKDWPPAE